MRLRLVSIGLALAALAARPEEGFWPFDMVPKDVIARRFEFDVTDAWLDKARRASLRVSTGGSGSFVSPHGLAMTNRHVVGSALQKLSVPGKTDLIRDGFFARTQADELKADGLRLEQLIEIVNVNDTVKAAMERFKIDDDGALRRIRDDAFRSERRDHVRIQAIKLYPEGEFRIYKFKTYDDVRIVFAADLSAGYFGGDVDNFMYPRYDFDVAFVRAYENGKPAETPDFFAWSPSGVKENELVFFTGNPAETERSITLAHLELQRDKILPAQIALYTRESNMLKRFATLGADQGQSVGDRIHSTSNNLKRLQGQADGLKNPAIFERKKSEEEAAGASIADPEKAREYTTALFAIRHAVERISGDQTEYELLQSPWGLNSAQLVAGTFIALMELRGGANFWIAEGREQQAEAQFAYDPRHRAESEQKHLEESFALMLSLLGPEHALSKLVLEDKTPAARAAELVAGSKLGRSEFYSNAQRGGFSGVDKSGDPMLILAKKILMRRLELLQRFQNGFDDITKKSYAAIAHALGLAQGTRHAPDGNFTPRLSFGTVLGYEDAGRAIRPFTCFRCLFQLCDEAGNREPYHLLPAWLAARGKLDPCTPFNFVTDADGYGGNSGSPVFNRNRELVGILFDGNYPGLVGKYQYDGRTKRSVCVDARAILQILERVYGATELLKEFTR